MVSSTESDTQDKIGKTLKLFGDVWVLNILNILAEVTQRFNELQRSLGPVSPTVLADRLKKLEQYGLIMQEKHTIDQLSVTYKLTDKGQSVLPLLKAVEQFARKL